VPDLHRHNLLKLAKSLKSIQQGSACAVSTQHRRIVIGSPHVRSGPITEIVAFKARYSDALLGRTLVAE
jgi:hypothetical protein